VTGEIQPMKPAQASTPQAVSRLRMSKAIYQVRRHWELDREPVIAVTFVLLLVLFYVLTSWTWSF
jgi:hypothetical protein